MKILKLRFVFLFVIPLFLDRKIPAITFHGLSNNWQKYLHSSNDKIGNINVQSVLGLSLCSRVHRKN